MRNSFFSVLGASASVLLLSLLAGCGGSGGREPGAGAGAQPAPTAPRAPALPNPQALANPRHAAAAVLYLSGAAYDTDVAQHVSAAGDTAQFAPQTDGTGPLPQAMAYALYRFSVSGKTGPQTLSLGWKGTPPGAAQSWIGLGNWGKNRWDWLPLPDTGALELDAERFVQYSHAGTSEMLCLLGLTGSQACTLQGLGFEPPPQVVQWPMFGHDPQHTFRSDYTGSQTGQLKWTFRTSGRGLNVSTPAVASDGTIYVSDSIYLCAYDPQGNVLWRFHPETSPGDPVVGTDGTILFSTGGSPSGDIEGYKLYAINPDGTVKWVCPDMAARPVIGADGTIYALPSPYLSTEGIVAFDPDGTERWSIPKDAEITGLAGAADGKVYYSDAAGLHALDAAGVSLWSVPEVATCKLLIGPDGMLYGWCSFGQVYSVTLAGVVNWEYEYPNSNCWPVRPAVGADGTVYVAFYRNNTSGTTAALCALTPAGNLSWSQELERGFYAVTLTAGGDVCALTYSMDYFGPTSMVCFDTSGGLIWTKALDGAYNGYSGLEALPDGGVVATAWYIGTICAVNADGSERWIRGAGGTIQWNPVIGADGTVYVGCNDGAVYAVAANGDLFWKHEQLGSSVQTPLINNNVVYTTSFNSISCDSLLLAFNLDGTQRWSYSAPASAMISSPTLGPAGTVCFGSGSSINTVDASGALSWHFLTEGYDDNVKCPAVSPDGTVYASLTNTSGTSAVYQFNALGAEQWEYAPDYTDDSHSPAIGADGTLYVCYGLSLLAVNPDGSVKWTYAPAGKFFLLTPALAADGTIYVSAHRGGISAVNPDGTSKWNFANEGDYCSTPAVDAAGKIYFGSSDSNVYCVDAAGQQVWKQPVTTLSSLSYATYSSPAIAADGTVYIGSGNQLYAFGD
jgi:outer membrane protein assembly factor BamB